MIFHFFYYVSLQKKSEPTVFFPYRQQLGYLGRVFCEVRTASDPLSLIPVIRQAIADINPSVPLTDFKTQATQLDESIAQERSFTFSAISLALFVVLLCCIGLFGLIAYQTTQRTSEIGIRMALGAQSCNIGFSVLCDALRLVFIGTVVGIPLVLITSRLIRSYLFGVKPYDTVTLLGAFVFLILVSMAAVIVPAWRAAKIDPMKALRYE